MKKINFIIVLMLQFLFVTELFSQTSYNRFMLAWTDFSCVETSITTMTQEYKDLQRDGFNCSVVNWRLINSSSSVHVYSTDYFQFVSSNPSKDFLDSAYKYDIKVLLTTPENCVVRVRDAIIGPYYYPYNSTASQ